VFLRPIDSSSQKPADGLYIKRAGDGQRVFEDAVFEKAAEDLTENGNPLSQVCELPVVYFELANR
jgi:hypothetical protein